MLVANMSVQIFGFLKFKKSRDGFRTAATSKGEPFVVIVNGWKPLTIITKSFTLDVPAVLDPLLHFVGVSRNLIFKSVSPPTSK